MDNPKKFDQSAYNLRPLWSAILDVYREYEKICKRHNLRFCTDGGTILGAVRHKGFIPWDDDFDVRMPGPDVDEFLKIAEKELPPHLKVVSWRNSKGYPYLFAKVIDTRKDVIDRVSRESNLPLPQGIYVDIFPFDGYPRDRVGCFWYRLRALCLLLRRHYLFSNAKTFRAYVARFCGTFLWPFFPNIKTMEDYMGYCEKLSRKYDFFLSQYCGWFNLGKAKLQRLDVVHSWNDLIYLPFEDIEVPVPKNYDAVLRASYGNYMELPPEDKRCLWHNWGEPVSWIYGPCDR